MYPWIQVDEKWILFVKLDWCGSKRKLVVWHKLSIWLRESSSCYKTVKFAVFMLGSLTWWPYLGHISFKILVLMFTTGQGPQTTKLPTTLRTWWLLQAYVHHVSLYIFPSASMWTKLPTDLNRNTTAFRRISRKRDGKNIYFEICW